MVWLRSLWHWCTALLIFAQSAFAHTEPVEPNEQVFTDWRVLCQAPEEMTTCRMLQSASTSEDEPAVFLLSISPGEEAGASYAVLTVPLGLYLAPGIEVGMNTGLDVGYVEPSARRSWSQDYLAGVSLGADIKIQNKATLTLQVAHALSRPDENPPNAQPAFEAGRTVGYVGFKVEF